MTVFLTGGSGGLGVACAEMFAARGERVAVVDRAGAEAAVVARRVSAKTGTEAVGIACDVTDPARVQEAWTSATEQLGPIEVVVNNAARLHIVPFLDLELADWQETLAVNLTGPFLVAQLAAREWITNGRGGSIVNVASSAAVRAGFSGAVDYGSSKSGLVGLTRQIAVALGPHGIRVNAVAPGSFFSPLNDERFAQPGYQEGIVAKVPLRRIGDAEDIAAAVVFLALDGGYVNGALLPVDGAMTVAQ